MDALFGRRLRQQRKLKGWTMEEFSGKVGLSPNYIGDLERGVKLPSLESFIRLVEALDVPADALIRDTVPSASYVADAELAEKLCRLSPRQKKAAMDILDAFIENLPYLTK